jgi:hypothetical protein
MAIATSPKFHGDPSIKALASGLGTLGRYGDSYMVHAAEGETFVPKEIFEANPQLKNDLLQQMAMMGIRDPDRFVVGNAMNSINPITGQPEFFFKSIFKAIKKVVKKIAPVVVPLVANWLAPGIGGILASGLMTKVQGGSWGDALKSAGMAWAGQGIMGGIKGAMRPGAAGGWSGFGTGLEQGFMSPIRATQGLFSGLSSAANPFNQGAFGSAGIGNLPGASWQDKYLPQYDPNAQFAATPGAGPTSSIDLGYGQGQNKVITTSGGEQLVVPTEADQALWRAAEPTEGPLLNQPLNKLGIKNLQDLRAEGQIGFEKFHPVTGEPLPVSEYRPGEGFMRGGQRYVVKEVPSVLTKGGQGFTQAGQEFVKVEPKGMFDFGITKAAKKGLVGLGVGPETAATVAEWGVPAAAIAAAGWALTDEEEEMVPSPGSKAFTAYDAWNKLTPDQKNSAEGQKLFWAWSGGSPYATREDFERRIGGQSGRPDWFFLPPAGGIQTVAGDQDTGGFWHRAFPGADIKLDDYPKAGGGEVMGPGTGRSDSIPARLSDGEFVMTAKAVENAGGGDRALGAARMYEMMNRFERSAA